MNALQREQMNVVIVGHVDHGKSTLVGRLLADTGSLPKGKLEEVKARCERNAKPFEYAFLLDALKDEQSQGITIDTARCFFKSKKRDYIIIDAPGHIEFLKNMVSGAARAEAAILVIDAHEGIRENSKRHGYMLSFLGINHIAVCVNKMDLADYREDVFEKIKKDYSVFLEEINVRPSGFIPISAVNGENMIANSAKMRWYQGKNVLEALDSFEKAPPRHALSFRLPVQDIYKFTEEGDDRRIVSGRIETGTIREGDEVIFLPSKKKSRIKSIEGFNVKKQSEVFAGQSVGVCLDTQIYIRPGEIMSKASEPLPHVSTKFKANIFWMGRQPFIQGKTYKLKVTSQQIPVVLSKIISVLDASELSSITNKPQIDRHDVAECVLETLKPVAFDEVTRIAETGRFVVVDNYEIVGGGIILAPVFDEDSRLKEHIKEREFQWERSDITPDKRAEQLKHKSALIVITGQANTGKQRIAQALEEELFKLKKFVYFLGISNQLLSAGMNWGDKTISKFDHIQHLGEMSRVMTDAGLILITSITDIDEYELGLLKSLNRPNPTVVIHVGNEKSQEGANLNLIENENSQAAVQKILDLLHKTILLDPEYSI